MGLVTAVLWARRDPGNPLENARFLPLTDFDGIEQAATISRDGKLAAFLSDRDGQMDVWVTQVGSGDSHNLTQGAARDVVNPSIRALGFSPDGTLVTFWARRLDASQRSETSVWGVPVLGGSPRVYLDGVAEYDWSDDETRLVYHTSGDGDPTFIREAGRGTEASACLLRRPQASIVISRCGRRTAHSSTSCRDRCRTAWTSGVSSQPVGHPNG